MTYFARDRKYRLRDFKKQITWNNGCDYEINQWKLVGVHLEEYPIVEGQGFDFYCSQGKDVYLLAFTKAKETKFSMAKSEGRDATIWLCVHTNFEKLSTDFIYECLNVFEKKGIPTAKFLNFKK